MLLKVQSQSAKKYIRLQAGFTYQDFIKQVKHKFGFSDSTELLVMDESNTEIDDDVFLELMEANPDICLKIQEIILDKSPSSSMDHPSSSFTDTLSPSSDTETSGPMDSWSPAPSLYRPNGQVLESSAAKQMVVNVLCVKPGGKDILEEYRSDKSLRNRSRRHLVNILASDITERHGSKPSHQQKENYALGIVTLFPLLKDPFTPKGYEHFYDAAKGTGYLSWRLKNIGRNKFKHPGKEVSPPQEHGPKRRRAASTAAGEQLQGGACSAAISFLSHASDVTSVFQKMKSTLEYRQELVHDPERNTDIFKTFPRFLDVKGLVNQDFTLLFGLETTSRLLERWDKVFKPKIITEAKHLTQTLDIHQLLAAAEAVGQSDNYWDSDMASLLLLLHLLPPTAGQRRVKISSSDAEKKLVHFHESSSSLEEHLSETENHQPYIVAVGQTKNRTDAFYVVVDHQPIPCQATSSLGAFDELFKAHFVFNAAFDSSLVQFYRFIQTTIYNIDVKSTEETPRLRELRAKILNGS